MDDDERTLTVYMRDRTLYAAAVDFFQVKLDERCCIQFGQFKMSIGKTIHQTGAYCWPGPWLYYVSCECPYIWEWARMQMFIGIFQALWRQTRGVYVSELENGFMPFFSTRKRFVVNTKLVDHFIEEHKYFWPADKRGPAFNFSPLNDSLSGGLTFMDGSHGFPENILDE